MLIRYNVRASIETAASSCPLLVGVPLTTAASRNNDLCSTTRRPTCLVRCTQPLDQDRTLITTTTNQRRCTGSPVSRGAKGSSLPTRLPVTLLVTVPVSLSLLAALTNSSRLSERESINSGALFGHVDELRDRWSVIIHLTASAPNTSIVSRVRYKHLQSNMKCETFDLWNLRDLY